MDTEKDPAPVFSPNIRVRLMGAQPFFGPGVAELLRGIQACGSIQGACERMGLSYSKSRIMLRRLEEELAYPVVKRSKGGVGGGSACLTDAGLALLTGYEQYEREVSLYAQKRFGALRTLLEQPS